MTLTTIFVIRHGFRSNWTTDCVTGETTSSVPSPTGIASDPALSAYGAMQSKELASQAEALDPPVARIYSSPFYRCIQTIEPLWSRLENVPLICDRGIGEWYGLARFTHPSPAKIALLQTFFPSLTESTSVVPSSNGERIDDLHDRCAYALARIIADVDKAVTSGNPESIVICSHAASIIAIGRALTGCMPSDANKVDFHTYTCSISRFERKSSGQESVPVLNKDQAVPHLNWRNGKGVGGGWRCEVNAGTDHLTNGGERDWHFNGDESFIADSAEQSDRAIGAWAADADKGKGSRL